MSRYLERAEHTARLLITQFEAMEDRSVEEIDLSWRRIYLAMGRSPAGGNLTSNLENEDFMLMDAYTLADDLTFELVNSDSIRSSMYFARENARQIRNVVGRQFWTNLNSAYLELRSSRIEYIWTNKPHNFYANQENNARTLSGYLDSSMYRDDGWHFLQMGRFMERTQLIAALLVSQIKIFSTEFNHQDSTWISLMVLCNARLAYRRQRSLFSINPRHVLEFLISDTAHPHSIHYSIERTIEHFAAISTGEERVELTDISKELKSQLLSIKKNWRSRSLTDIQICEILQNLLSSNRETYNEIASAYFFN